MTGWQNFPFQISVKAGETKFFCSCTQSKKGPFCDGSHKGTEFSPTKITYDKEGTVFICGCQRSHHHPECDGTHKQRP